ncbi:hypothetical protein D3C80_1953480 [compost metagenome]
MALMTTGAGKTGLKSSTRAYSFSDTNAGFNVAWLTSYETPTDPRINGAMLLPVTLKAMACPTNRSLTSRYV